MSSNVRSDTLMSVEEFERYGGEEGCIVELVRGALVRERGPSPLHGRLQSRMGYLLERWMEERGERGAVLTNAGLVLATDPATVRLPDVAYVSPGRIPETGYGGGLWWLGPDLAVEVVSPSNTWTDIQERVTDYIGAGALLVWVVDPPTRTITAYRPDVRARRLSVEDELEGGEVLPGLRIALADYFDV